MLYGVFSASQRDSIEIDFDNLEALFGMLSGSVITNYLYVHSSISVDESFLRSAETHLRSVIVTGKVMLAPLSTYRDPTALSRFASYFRQVGSVGTGNSIMYTPKLLRECFAAGYRFSVRSLTQRVLTDFVFSPSVALPNDRCLHAVDAQLPNILNYLKQVFLSFLHAMLPP